MGRNDLFIDENCAADIWRPTDKAIPPDLDRLLVFLYSVPHSQVCLSLCVSSLLYKQRKINKMSFIYKLVIGSPQSHTWDQVVTFYNNTGWGPFPNRRSHFWMALGSYPGLVFLLLVLKTSCFLMITLCVYNEHGHLQKLESSFRECGLWPASCSTFSIISSCTQLKPLHYSDTLLGWKIHREVKFFHQECFWLLNGGGNSLLLWDRQHLLKSHGKERNQHGSVEKESCTEGN